MYYTNMYLKKKCSKPQLYKYRRSGKKNPFKIEQFQNSLSQKWSLFGKQAIHLSYQIMAATGMKCLFSLMHFKIFFRFQDEFWSKYKGENFSILILIEKDSSGQLDGRDCIQILKMVPEFPFLSGVNFTRLRLFPSECFRNSYCQIVFTVTLFNSSFVNYIHLNQFIPI